MRIFGGILQLIGAFCGIIVTLKLLFFIPIMWALARGAGDVWKMYDWLFVLSLPVASALLGFGIISLGRYLGK